MAEELVTLERASYTIAKLAGVCMCVCGASQISVSFCLPSLLLHLLTFPPQSFTLVHSEFSPFAEEYSFKIELQKQSAHKPLLQLLQSPDPDVQVSTHTHTHTHTHTLTQAHSQKVT